MHLFCAQYVLETRFPTQTCKIKRARPQPSNTDLSNRKQEICRKRKVHKMFYVENPNVGKTTAVHRLQTITMIVNVCTTVKLRGNDLELTIFATGGGNTQRQRPLTLSLSVALFTLAPTRVAMHNEQQHASAYKTVCPRSYLY